MPGGIISDFVLDSESCYLSSAYAWYHVLADGAFAVIFAAYLLLCKRDHDEKRWWREASRAAHYFGIFAMLADYGYCFLTQGTRSATEFYIRPDSDVTVQQNGLQFDGIRAFFFFLWFDYFGAWALVLWAFALERVARTALQHGSFRASLFDMFVLLHQPILFWSAPPITMASLGDQGALGRWLSDRGTFFKLSRPSPKQTHAVMLLAFAMLLKKVVGLSWKRDIAPIIISGIGCSLVHHAALFYHNMRGYRSIEGLLVTVLTEWPALICGAAFFRRVDLGGHQWILRILPGTFIATIIAMMVQHMDERSPEKVITSLLPFIPGDKIHTLGSSLLWLSTCFAPSVVPSAVIPAKLNCRFKEDNDVWVLSAAAKSGALFSGKLAMELATACGECVASGSRSREGIPGPVENLPEYEGSILLAVNNMRSWPEYAPKYNRASKCIAFYRDPINRLKSLYFYARSGGEHYFRASGIMEMLEKKASRNSVERSVKWFWEMNGQGYLIQSHKYNMLNAEKGCHMVPLENLNDDYDGTIRGVLEHLQVDKDAIPALLTRMQKHDLSRYDASDLKLDPHISRSKFSAQEHDRVRSAFESMPEVVKLAEGARRQLAVASGRSNAAIEDNNKDSSFWFRFF